MSFSGKKILILVTGGIAAYKINTLVRDFVKENRSNDNPCNRPQAIQEAISGRCQRHRYRHLVEQNGNCQGQHHGNRASDMPFHTQHSEREKEKSDRNQSNQAGQPDIA